ncbi:MAG: YraN family protein, partial [Firmicutes bacterium]|nr:YraN family protein [Candidatus Colimorpha enterica]
MNEKQKTGAHGEDVAAKWFEEHGYRIIARNYVSGKDEIDVIAEDDHAVVFVEVKTRNETIPGYGRPSLAINRKKRLCLIRCAKAYMKTHISEKLLRFDVIYINIYKDGNEAVNYIKNAFGADGKVI